MGPEGPYRDPREGERLHGERRAEEAREAAEFRAGLGRRRGPLVLAFAVLLLAAGAALAVLRARTRDQAPSPEIFLAAQAECGKLRVEYTSLLPRSSCRTDDACVAEARGGIWSSLDGCLRVLPRGASTEAADALAEHWKGRGCAHAFRICAPPRGAICESGACVEAPPPSVPRTWRRREVQGVLVFFAPPGLTEDPSVGGDDSVVVQFSSNDTDLMFDIYGLRDGDDGGDELGPGTPWGTSFDAGTLTVGGFRGQMARGRRPDGRYSASLRIKGLSDEPMHRGPVVGVSANATCDTERACDDAEKALRTAEAWAPR